MTESKAKVRKAVIPAAGFGTRMFPATKVVKKELFPIIDKDGRAKPIIQIIVEEAINAGIENVGIVIQKSDFQVFTDFFQAIPSYYQKLSPEKQEYCQYLQNLGSKITLLTQSEQAGYGHAVFCAKEWVGDEPFLLLLGDHIYTSEVKKSCASQILQVYEQTNKSVIGVRIIPGTEIHHYGCISGSLVADGIINIDTIYEKPELNYARQKLHVAGMKEDEFLGVFGIYLLTAKIFDYLEENIKQNVREKGEFQLTSCLDKLQKTEGMNGYLVKGRCFDTGMPDVYWQTMIDFRNA
ncbi:MAG: UTP--glucose-1-phosphate uridylyltransferase [Okeania sp. SIO2G4]|uniref:UTP--glucose-1-phosphate uridylyltransferase n=1 Tax=unclassified Okeania TaxID=2634635 RepID=UPI0013BDF078|nr:MULTISPECIES: UTP--glucose-1-phosphate uridylyltransferase [unclassified Okeania]NEP41474.1 UTP--glucose-1-phosphate uridylyltransferase [Okeania sp. SIO2H7]NEP75669.1 UTP--glucose-1-phosphate uridylyltransferase [Okeania sp. SIO2G5]NEP94615.1 UTP--glucose-1-phosphate uridylyltransferase [Okeania sp. SIO2F5]NEQ91583.1 UTP--glucose-1-phosphate uridylyltransferase [Okeania sp. SIO2G4]